MSNKDPGSNGGIAEKDHGATPPRSRLEAEVLEILERSEKPIPFSARVRRITWRRRRDRLFEYLRSPLQYVTRFGTRAIAIAALICAIMALFLNDAAPLLSRVAGFAFIILIGIFFFVGFKGSPGGRAVKRWRGRDIGFDPSRDNDDEGRFRGPWRR